MRQSEIHNLQIESLNISLWISISKVPMNVIKHNLFTNLRLILLYGNKSQFTIIYTSHFFPVHENNFADFGVTIQVSRKKLWNWTAAWATVNSVSALERRNRCVYLTNTHLSDLSPKVGHTLWFSNKPEEVEEVAILLIWQPYVYLRTKPWHCPFRRFATHLDQT